MSNDEETLKHVDEFIEDSRNELHQTDDKTSELNRDVLNICLENIHFKL